MRTGLNLSQQLNVKLMMTPEMQQSIHILQLSSYELSQYLHEQVVENPMLEIEIYPGSYPKNSKSVQRTDAETDPLWSVEAREDTLEHGLLGQLRMARLPADLYKAAAYLAGNLDEAGYLTLSITEVSTFLKQPKEIIEAALAHLQSLDPAGVGARNLQECLLIQIAKDPYAKPGAYQVVSQFLQQLTQGKLDKIALYLDVSITEVKQIVTYIRGLNPRPGSAYSASEVHYVIPDAVIHREHEEFVIRMNPATVPKLSVNHEYYKYIQTSDCTHTVSFLKEKMKSASLLVRSLEQRKLTLYRVIQAIFEEQTAFLERGISGMQPLNLKIISEKLDLHESTVSRAVRNKYVRTPSGIFELKYFFSTGLQTNVGEFASIKKIKARIKELISQENKTKPYSDQKIVDVLTDEGIHISRRTVTKYRKELNILSSALRKSICE